MAITKEIIFGSWNAKRNGYTKMEGANWAQNSDDPSPNPAHVQEENRLKGKVWATDHIEEYDNDGTLINRPPIADGGDKDARERLISTHSSAVESPPQDRYSAVYLSFYVLGVASMIAWNFFITATGYWLYKFRDTNSTKWDDPEVRTDLQVSFFSYLSMANMVPGTICFILNAFFSSRVSLKFRLVLPMFSMFVLFIWTTVLVEINTDSMQTEFFALTMTIVIVLSSSCAFFQGSVTGIAGLFPSHHLQAIINGQAVAGIFASLARIGSLAFNFPVTESALVYFIIADVVLFVSIITYFLLRCNPFYKYYVAKYEAMVLQRSLEVEKRESLFKVSFDVLIKTKRYAISLTLIFFTTLSVFPSITILVVSEGRESHTLWGGKYFIPIACFLLFNCGDFAGRIIAEWFDIFPPHSYLLPLTCAGRLVFIPLIMFCNAHPRHHLPVLVTSDIGYVVIMTLFSLSNGYLASLCYKHATKIVTLHQKELVGTTMAAMVSLGLMLGAFFSKVCIHLL